MAVDAITSGTSSAGSAGKTSAQMGSEDFYKLLIAELRYQDPMQPMDNSKMVEQVAGIRQIEASANMSLALESVTRQQNFGTGANLIGKMVIGKLTDKNGNEQYVDGVVTAVRFEKNGKVILDLDSGSSLPLETVVEVRNLSAAADGPGAESDAGEQPA